jgi:hypothetical protein
MSRYLNHRPSPGRATREQIWMEAVIIGLIDRIDLSTKRQANNKAYTLLHVRAKEEVVLVAAAEISQRDAKRYRVVSSSKVKLSARHQLGAATKKKRHTIQPNNRGSLSIKRNTSSVVSQSINHTHHPQSINLPPDSPSTPVDKPQCPQHTH